MNITKEFFEKVVRENPLPFTIDTNVAFENLNMESIKDYVRTVNPENAVEQDSVIAEAIIHTLVS